MFVCIRCVVLRSRVAPANRPEAQPFDEDDEREKEIDEDSDNEDSAWLPSSAASASASSSSNSLPSSSASRPPQRQDAARSAAALSALSRFEKMGDEEKDAFEEWLEQSVDVPEAEEEEKDAPGPAAISEADHQLAPSGEKEPESVTNAFFKVSDSFLSSLSVCCYRAHRSLVLPVFFWSSSL